MSLGYVLRMIQWGLAKDVGKAYDDYYSTASAAQTYLLPSQNDDWP